jgi:aspartate-semialdehyde dehydrogenase
MVQALKPLDNLYGIKRVDVSTYQATSGAGKAGMEELVMQMQDFFAFKLDESKKEAFMHQIALNVIPQVDKAMDSGFTKEEEKMIYETQKILHKEIAIAATCVRVPVLRSHSESITVTFSEDIDIDVDECRKVINNFENVEVMDNLAEGIYPMPILSTDTDITLVGRIRKDIYSPNILHFFNVADQIRVGAATNSIGIALK